MVEISETDIVVLSITPVDSVYLRSFTGDLARREFEIDPVEDNDVIDASGFEGSLRFEEITMTVNVYNQLGIDLLVDLNITGYKNNRNESIRLTFDDNPILVPAAPENETETATKVLNMNNSNLVEFLEFLPEDIVTSGNTIVEGEGDVSRTSEVWSDYHLFSPFFLKIQDDALYASDIEGSEINESTREAIERGDVDNFNIDLGLFNGLPVGAQMKIYLSASRQDIFDEIITDSSKKIIIDNIQFTAGELGPDNFVTEGYEDEYQIGLTPDQLFIFTNDSVFLASKLFLDDTDGLVKFRSTDEISANGSINIRIRLNNED